MRTIRESYNRDEIKQRVIDTRNIMSALQDSLSILQSSLSDVDSSLDKEECDKLARYTRTYAIDIEDMMKDFYDDFEKFIEDDFDEEEDDFDGSFSGQDFDDEEIVEESINLGGGMSLPFDINYCVFVNSKNRTTTIIPIPDRNAFKNAENKYGSFINVFETLEEAQKYIKSFTGPSKDFNVKTITEDTVKTSDGKWTNKGDTGETHGKFKTKKEADAQRRAIFANGYKESLDEVWNSSNDIWFEDYGRLPYVNKTDYLRGPWGYVGTTIGDDEEEYDIIRNKNTDEYACTNI